MPVSRSRILAAVAAVTAIAALALPGLTSAQATPRTPTSTGNDTPTKLNPKGEIADELAGSGVNAIDWAARAVVVRVTGAAPRKSALPAWLPVTEHRPVESTVTMPRA